MHRVELHLVLNQRPGHAAAALGALWIGYWSAAPTADDCEAASRAMCELHHRLGVPLRMLSIIGRGVRPSSNEVRGAAARSTQIVRDLMQRGAVVIEQEGLLAAALVSITTGIMMMVRVTSVRVFLETRTGARFVTEDDADHEAALAAVAQLRTLAAIPRAA